MIRINYTRTILALRIIAILISISILTTAPVVDSLTATERRTYTFQGIEFIDDPCSPDPNGEIRSLRGTDNQEKIWNYFMDIGLKPEQAAGIMGNIQTESAGNRSALVFQKQGDP